MFAVSTIVLVMLGVFIQSSDAIRCYICATPYRSYCDDQLEDGLQNGNVNQKECLAKYDACLTAQGGGWGKNNKIFTESISTGN